MLARLTLLLADDSPTVQKVVSLTFADEGMRVLTASGGEEALAILGETVPDVLLADVHMPAPGGYELCARVKRDPRTARVPVLLLVGTFEPFDEAEAREAGADGILTKPFQSIRELVNKVGGLISGHPEQSRDAAEAREAASAAAPPAATLDAHVSPPPPAAEDVQPPPVFAGLDADDESIQSVRADDYVAANRARASDAAAEFVAIDEPLAQKVVGGVEEVVGVEAAGAVEASSLGAAAGSRGVRGYGAATLGARQAGAGFAARPSKPAAEDSLLELGEFAVPSYRGAADVDDLILDIGDDDAFDAFQGASAVSDEPDAVAEISPANLSSAWSDAPLPEASPAPTIFNDSMPESEAAPESVEPDSEVYVPTAVSAEPAVEFERVETAGEALIAGSAARPTEVADARTDAAETSTGVAQLSPEMVDAVARRVVELMSDRAVREIAWEVVPDLAERLIRERLEEEKLRAR